MIYLGSDHGGFKLKQKIKSFLKDLEYEYEDLGNLKFDKDDDYPDYAFKVAEKVSDNIKNKGILLCRSSGGMVIAANKVKGIKAVSVIDEKSVKHAVEHNNANIIALSGDWMTEQEAKDAVKVFLETDFTKEERHKRRINMIKEYEKK